MKNNIEIDKDENVEIIENIISIVFEELTSGKTIEEVKRKISRQVNNEQWDTIEGIIDSMGV